MRITAYLKLYLYTVPIFFAIDMLWLGVIAKQFYQTRLAHLLATDVNWAAALVFYAIYIAGILLFAVVPGLRARSLRKALLHAAGFGFFTYITYELTNMATLPNWPLSMVVIDTLWGVALCSAVAAAAYGIGVRSTRIGALTQPISK